MENFAIASVISVLLIIACVAVFHEILAHIWVNLPRLEGKPRRQILLTVLASFVGHTIAVWMFGIVYYVLSQHFSFGGLSGDIDHELNWLSL